MIFNINRETKREIKSTDPYMISALPENNLEMPKPLLQMISTQKLQITCQ